jgi:lipopolysaccharide export system permease protein
LNRLDRYIFRQAAVPFLLILLCTTAVIWLTQILQRADLMVEDGGSLLSFLKVTILLLPSLLGVITPFALLAAALYSLNVLATDNELPVMGAAGASRVRIARPVILLSVLAGLFVFLINIDLQPRSYRVLKETVELVRSDIAKAFIQSGIFTEVTPGVTVYAEEARPGDQYIGLLIHDVRDPEEPVTYTAERGLFSATPAGPRLLLARVTMQTPDPETGSIDILRFIETAVDLATFNEEGEERRLESTERYVSELLNPDMSDEYDRERAGRFIAEGHARLATPLYPIAFGMMALAFMLTAPVSRRGYGRRLMLAIVAAVILRTIGYVLQNAGSTSPAVNVFQYVLPLAAIVVAGAVIAGRFWRARRRPPPDLSAVLDDPSRVSGAA